VFLFDVRPEAIYWFLLDWVVNVQLFLTSGSAVIAFFSVYVCDSSTSGNILTFGVI
jgi:hypothetical protein